MRERKPGSGPLSSLFVPIFVGALCGWVLPYMLLRSPLSGDRFIDGVIGLVLCGIIGGIVGAMLKKQKRGS